MKLKIEIKMDNAAFDSDDGEEPSRILADLAQQLRERTTFVGFSQGLYDINGNRVGEAKVTR